MSARWRRSPRSTPAGRCCATSPAVTADGTPVRLMLNVGLSLELAQLDAVGADGIGLFRTEIAMLARGAVADVAEQAAIYARVLDDAGTGRCCSARSISAPTSCCRGWRPTKRIRRWAGGRCVSASTAPPCCAASCARYCSPPAGGKLSVMFPMVSTVGEFRAARALLLAEARRVRPAPEKLEIGTMLEVPALMWQLPELLRDADFISVGSNDLLQFMFAVDRGTPSLYGRYDLLSQPVLDLLEQLLAAAKAAKGGAGVPVSLCGEAASRPLEALALVGWG